MAAPATARTRHLIDADVLQQVKRGIHLVNIARGALVDQYALRVALDDDRVAMATLDTVDPEPLPDPHPLRNRDNVIVTPHTAWYSEQALVGLQAGAPGEVKRVLSGEWPVNVVNRDVKGRNRAGL